MKRRCFHLRHCLIPVLSLWSSLSSLTAAREWVESVYLTEAPPVATELPQPQASWKLHLRQRLCLGEKNAFSEILHGPGDKAKRWRIGQYVILLNADGTASIYEASLLREMPIFTEVPSATWTKNLEPLRTLQSKGGEVLVYEAPVRSDSDRKVLVWVAKDDGRLLAKAEDSIITLYEISKGNVPEPQPNAEEMTAINAAFAARQKDEQHWKLP